MSARVRVDVDGMDDLVTVLGSVGRRAMSEGKKVVSRGSLNIKQQWARTWSGHGHIQHLPRSIGYDLAVVGTTITGETGPDMASSQGPLGHLIELGDAEYGNVNNPPIPGGLPALLDEAPKFRNAVEDLAVQLLERR